MPSVSKSASLDSITGVVCPRRKAMLKADTSAGFAKSHQPVDVEPAMLCALTKGDECDVNLPACGLFAGFALLLAGSWTIRSSVQSWCAVTLSAVPVRITL